MPWKAVGRPLDSSAQTWNIKVCLKVDLKQGKKSDVTKLPAVRTANTNLGSSRKNETA